jgi:GNAT superfamily N-acetyltransferase
MITFKQFLAEGKIKDETGYISWNWKTDLPEEEDDPNYIPKGYKNVLELGMLSVDEPGQGHGEVLMKKFLETPDAKKASLIFLDPNPGEGVNWNSKMSEKEQVDRLIKFYKRFGFRHNPKSATRRMWLVQKGSIPDDELPT